MKYTSSWFEGKSTFFAFLISLFILNALFAGRICGAGQTERKGIVLLEFSQKDLSERSMKAYFGGLKRFFRDKLALETFKATPFRTMRDGPDELQSVSPDTVFVWKEKLGRGKRYFTFLEVLKGTNELTELIESPYRYHLRGKALEIVNEAILSYSFILFKTGEGEMSQKLISRYTFLSGNSEISEQIFPPDFVKYFEEISSKPHYATLGVNSTPSNAKVFLDGKIIGHTPLFQKIKKVGFISLSVRKNGYVEYVINRVLMPEDRLALDLDLEIDEVSEIENGVQKGDYEEVAESMRNLVSRMDKEGGLVAVLKGEEAPSAIDFIFSTRNAKRGQGGYSIYRDITHRGRSFRSKDMQQLLNDELFLGFVPHAMRPGIVDEGLKKEKLTGKWWFWAVIGAGVAGAIYAITRGGGNDSGGSVNIEF